MLTEEQYLSLARAADFKSEFFHGEMFAMPGVSMRHTDLQSNIPGELFAAFRDGECRVHGPDFRIRVSSSMYSYPDISMVCGKPNRYGLGEHLCEFGAGWIDVFSDRIL
jgi:Uma2 family endonuclease